MGISNPGDGGGSVESWSLVASGLVANAETLNNVFIATLGKSYCGAVWIAQTSGDNVSGTDHQDPNLVRRLGQTPAFVKTIPNINERILDLHVPLVSVVGLAVNNAIAFAGSDSLEIEFDSDGNVYNVTHTDGGGSTNGMYQIWEKA